MKKAFLIIQVFLLFSNSSFGQQDYFNFWTDKVWKNEYALYRHDTVRDNSTYKVKFVTKNLIKENWVHLESGEKIIASIERVYDDLDATWYMIYSDKNFSTVWKSELIDGVPMFIKQFVSKDKTYFSRQYWKIVDHDVLHIIEKSDDRVEWVETYRSLLVENDGYR